MTTTHTAIIQLGEKDGITVAQAGDSYTITLPNHYDISHHFFKLSDTKPSYAPDPAKDSISNLITYTSKSVFDMTEQEQKQIQMNISKARNTYTEMMAENQVFKSAIHFDHKEKDKELYFNGIPLKLSKDAEGNTIMTDKNLKKKEPGYLKGDVVQVGKYFVAFKNDQQNSNGDTTINMIETSKFLKLDDYKQPDRFEQVCKHLMIDSKTDIVNQEVKPGISRYVAFNANGLVDKIKKTYSKELKQEATPEQAQKPITKKQQVKTQQMSR